MTNTVRAVHQSVHAALNDRLGTGVDRAGRLVEDHDRRIGDRSTGDGEQLTLALATGCAPSPLSRVS